MYKWGEYHQFLLNTDVEVRAANKHEVPPRVAPSEPSGSVRLSKKTNVKLLDDGTLNVDNAACPPCPYAVGLCI